MIRGFFRRGAAAAGRRIYLHGYDGARWVADQSLRFTRFGEFWNDIHQIQPAAFRTWVESHAPWLWNSVIRIVLEQPVFAVMGVLGILLMPLFRRRKPLIGYSRD